MGFSLQDGAARRGASTVQVTTSTYHASAILKIDDTGQIVMRVSMQESAVAKMKKANSRWPCTSCRIIELSFSSA
jgi:hypothetical protein